MLRMLIKVPLLLLENIIFSLFPNFRSPIEKSIFNPYFFGGSHNKYSLKKFNIFKKDITPYLSLSNKTILELGPGGSLGFGLLALKGGAVKYYTIDSGLHSFISRKQFLDYTDLINSRSRITNYIEKVNNTYVYNKQRIKLFNITQNSEYALPDNSIDIIYSCAVLEHVHDLELCFNEMTRVLKPGGIMHHEVDLRDHIFLQNNLLFLKIPEKLYLFLFKNCGAYTNRKRFIYYKQIISKHNLTILDMTTKNYSQFTSELSENNTTSSFTVILKKNA